MALFFDSSIRGRQATPLVPETNNDLAMLSLQAQASQSHCTAAQHCSSQHPMSLWTLASLSLPLICLHYLAMPTKDTMTSPCMPCLHACQVANMIFLDSPAGVGLSYSQAGSKDYRTDDMVTAADAEEFLRK